VAAFDQRDRSCRSEDLRTEDRRRRTEVRADARILEVLRHLEERSEIRLNQVLEDWLGTGRSAEGIDQESDVIILVPLNVLKIKPRLIATESLGFGPGGPQYSRPSQRGCGCEDGSLGQEVATRDFRPDRFASLTRNGTICLNCF
jgi:hypothetical protein